MLFVEDDSKQRFVCTLQTPIGNMQAIASAKGLKALAFEEVPGNPSIIRPASKVEILSLPEPNDILLGLSAQLDLYFQKANHLFSIPLAPSGTPFQLDVWTALIDIPVGQTRTYLEQTRSFKSETSIRAVARANGANPIAIILPCHRVIGSDGKLTGYSGGLWRKQYLLNHESLDNPIVPGIGRQSALPF